LNVHPFVSLVVTVTVNVAVCKLAVHDARFAGVVVTVVEVGTTALTVTDEVGAAAVATRGTTVTVPMASAIAPIGMILRIMVSGSPAFFFRRYGNFGGQLQLGSLASKPSSHARTVVSNLVPLSRPFVFYHQ